MNQQPGASRPATVSVPALPSPLECPFRLLMRRPSEWSKRPRRALTLLLPKHTPISRALTRLDPTTAAPISKAVAENAATGDTSVQIRPIRRSRRGCRSSAPRPAARTPSRGRLGRARRPRRRRARPSRRTPIPTPARTKARQQDGMLGPDAANSTYASRNARDPDRSTRRGAVRSLDVPGGDARERRGDVVADVEQRARSRSQSPSPRSGVRSSVARRISSVAAMLPSSNAQTASISRPSRPRSTGRTWNRIGWRSRRCRRGRCRIA